MPPPLGRIPGWVKSKGPRTVGAVTMERFDENGCFEDEWKKIGHDTHVFGGFAKPGGRSAHYGDVNLAAVGEEMIKTLKVQCQKRSTASTKQEELQRVIEAYSRRVVVPDDTTPLSDRCQLVINPSKPGLDKLHLPGGDAPVVFKGLVPELVSEFITLDPAEAMMAVDHVFATARYQVAQQVFGKAKASADEERKRYKQSFTEAVDKIQEVKGYIEDVANLTTFINHCRENSNNADIAAEVKRVCDKVGVAVPDGMPVVPAAEPAEPAGAALPDNPKPVAKRERSASQPKTLLDTVSLKAMMTKLYYKAGEDVSATMADEDDDGTITSSEFGEWFKDYCESLELEEPNVDDINREWDVLTGGGKTSLTLDEFKDAIEVIQEEAKTSSMTTKEKIMAKRAKKNRTSSASSSSASSLGLEGRMRGGGSNDSVSLDYFFVSGIYCTTTLKPLKPLKPLRPSDPPTLRLPSARRGCFSKSFSVLKI